METPQLVVSISNSFSYRWLMNIESSHHPLADSRCSFIDMDPAFISRRWMNHANDDFEFNLPRSESSFPVHADKNSSKALLPPLHSTTAPRCAAAYNCLDGSRPLSSSRSLLISSSNRCRSRLFNSSPVGRPANFSNSSPLLIHSARGTPNSMSSSSIGISPSKSWKFKLHFFGNCVKASKKRLQTYLCSVIPLCKKVKCSRLISSKSVKSCKDAAGGAPRTSNSFSNVEWCRSNADISIHDAILHCKRSFGRNGDLSTISEEHAQRGN